MQLIKTIVLFFFPFGLWGQYHIELEVENYKGDSCQLFYAIGNRVYPVQTVGGEQGKFVFTGEKQLSSGFYYLKLLKEQVSLQFLVHGETQEWRIKTRVQNNLKRDIFQYLAFEENHENQLFLDYQRFIMQMQGEKQALQQQRAANGKFQELNARVKAYEDKVIRRYPQSFCTKIMLANRPPKIPMKLTNNQRASARYYKEHYWDNFDWREEGFLRSGIYQKKLGFYLEKLFAQDPDSLKGALDYVLTQSQVNEELHQWTCKYLIYKYARSENLCLDALYVYLADKYFAEAKWVKEEDRTQILAQANRIRHLNCGAKAVDLELIDLQTEQKIKLSTLKGKYVALYFWDPSCGNCSKMSKAFVEVYKKYKDKGFEIYGVCSKNWANKDLCLNKIEELNLAWKNVSADPKDLARAKAWYAVKANPFVYLIDKEQRILYKRMTPEQIDRYLAYVLK